MTAIFSQLPDQFGPLPPQSLWPALIEESAADRRHYCATPNPEAKSKTLANVSCGDQLTLSFLKKADHLSVTWQGHGCILAMAGAAGLTALLSEQTPSGARQVVAAYPQLFTQPPASVAQLYPKLGVLALLVATVKFPVRIKCAVLAAKTAQAALTPATRPTANVNLKMQPVAGIDLAATTTKKDDGND